MDGITVQEWRSSGVERLSLGGQRRSERGSELEDTVGPPLPRRSERGSDAEDPRREGIVLSIGEGEDDQDDGTDDEIPTRGRNERRPTPPAETGSETIVGVSTSTDLHSLGLMYLRKYEQIPFDVAVMLHFLSILISYALAGSQAYSQVVELVTGVEVPETVLVLPFVIGLTLLVVIGRIFLEYVITVFTMIKGVLLALIVLATSYIGYQARHSVVNNWWFVNDPFLVSTVALGGAVNIVPVVFGDVYFARRDLRLFCIAISTGLFLTYLLNVVWCYAILNIVPQQREGFDIESVGDVVYTLYDAQKQGKIAITPLINVIHRDYPQFNWIANLVDVFIVFSITVSFVTMSLATKHVLDGFARSWRGGNGTVNPRSRVPQFLQRVYRVHIPIFVRRILLYGFFFGLVLLLAVLNPEAFLSMMEKVTSMALNLESGFFIVLMFTKARRITHNFDMPFSLPEWIYSLRWPVMLYFSYAIVYDLVLIILTDVVGLKQY